MAEQKRSTLKVKFIWVSLGFFILAFIAAGSYFVFQFQNIQSTNTERETLKTNKIKGKVWMERATKAHDADDHDKEFELLLKSANFDYAPAIAKISKNYETGNYVHQSDLKAREWAAKLPQQQYLQFLFRRGYGLTETGQPIEDIKLGLEFLEDGIEIAPENNNKTNAQQRIGWIYHRGPESVRDAVKAQQVFEIIGGTQLENFLGMQGFEAEQSGDIIKARQYYQKAVDAGSIKAKVTLAYNYSNDRDIEEGLDIADKLIAEVLQTDEPSSRHQAAIYLIERGTDDDEVLGLKVLEGLADSNLERSSLYLIDYYSDNPNIKPDYAKTAKYIQKVKYMTPKIKVTLAHLKRTGTSIPKDTKAAFKLYEEAANDGYDLGKLALAHMHRLGLGTAKNSQIANTLYEAARYDDRHPASYYIGLMHEQGELGPVNMKKAIELYRLASEAEYGAAFLHLAKLYETGQHVKQDKVKAFKLMTEAAYTDHPEAIKSLANYYSQGIGTERSSEYAAIWRSKKITQPISAFD